MKPVHWLKSELKTKRWLIAGLAGVFLISVSVSYYLYKFNIINSGWASILIGLIGLELLFFSLRQEIISTLDFTYTSTLTGKMATII